MKKKQLKSAQFNKQATIDHKQKLTNKQKMKFNDDRIRPTQTNQNL